MRRRLVARLDNFGDVLLAGPAVRAAASDDVHVTFLAGSSGSSAAGMLPGVDEVLVFDAPWVSYEPAPVDPAVISSFVARIRERSISEAVVLTSFHQSPLPLALLLRQAGVGWIGATCVDFPGSLLDLRHPYRDELHEVEQALELCAATGFHLPPGDDGRLSVDLPPRSIEVVPRPYLAVHPGASVPARALPVEAARATVAALSGEGNRVVVTGSAAEVGLVESVASAGDPDLVHPMAGITDVGQLAHLLAEAGALICGNTGPAHLAAAVATPVIEAFAPVVPAHRWRPWGVPHVLLGRTDIECAGCRSRVCPREGQPCLDLFTPQAVLSALESLGLLTGAVA